MEDVETFLSIVTSVVGVASIFESFLPPPARGILLLLKRGLTVTAFNVGYAKNRERK